MLTPEEQKELDGLAAEFGGLSPDEALELQALEKSFKEEGFFDRVQSDLAKRGEQASGIIDERRAGDIGRPEQIYRMAGQAGAGAVGDVVGNVIAEGARGISSADKFLGGHGAKALGAIGGAIGSLPSAGGGTIGEGLPKEIAGLAENYEGFAESNPRAASNIESGVNLAALGTGALKFGDDIIDAGTGAVKSLKAKKYMTMEAEELRQRGGKLFELADELGGGIKPEFYTDWLDDIESGIKGKTSLGEALGRVGGNKQNVEEAVDALKSVSGEAQSLKAVKEADEILGGLAESNTLPNGKYTPDGKDFLMMQMKLRDKIDNAPDGMFTGTREGFEAVKEARKAWSSSYRLNDVETIMNKARDAQQPSTVIKNGFRRLRDNPKKMRGYTPEERFAINKAAKTGAIEGFFKLAGSGLGPVIAGAGGFVAGGPVAGLTALGGSAAIRGGMKGGADAIAASKGEAVKRAISATAKGEAIPYTTPYLNELAAKTTKAVSPIGAAYAPQKETLSQRAQRIYEAKRNK